MLIRCHRESLPRIFNATGLMTQADIPIGSGRLYAKVLIFNNNRNLARFWKEYTGHTVGRQVEGLVNALSHHSVLIDKEGTETYNTLWVDRRYFCLVGLINTHLTLHIIAHEAVHVGFCYAKRRARSPWDVHIERFDEEAIAYPAGEFVRQMIEWLNEVA